MSSKINARTSRSRSNQNMWEVVYKEPPLCHMILQTQHICFILRSKLQKTDWVCVTVQTLTRVFKLPLIRVHKLGGDIIFMTVKWALYLWDMSAVTATGRHERNCTGYKARFYYNLYTAGMVLALWLWGFFMLLLCWLSLSKEDAYYDSQYKA